MHHCQEFSLRAPAHSIANRAASPVASRETLGRHQVACGLLMGVNATYGAGQKRSGSRGCL